MPLRRDCIRSRSSGGQHHSLSLHRLSSPLGLRLSSQHLCARGRLSFGEGRSSHLCQDRCQRRKEGSGILRNMRHTVVCMRGRRAGSLFAPNRDAQAAAGVGHTEKADMDATTPSVGDTSGKRRDVPRSALMAGASQPRSKVAAERPAGSGEKQPVQAILRRRWWQADKRTSAFEKLVQPLGAQSGPPGKTPQLRISNFQPLQVHITQGRRFLCACKHHDVPKAEGGG
ncbi:hypothetical protein J2W36_002432 [Variovorax ginsengisoli]|uniref:Uncharacterized protein n=1 Tax=Variovorax ginsengisoli TaxID=363844 RepID=A0ABT9S8D6_9BURK|nr:hypothetical protein [Variovorax ginsengisoli]